MQPTLNPDSSRWRDIGLFNRFDIHSMHNYKRDDIVCLRSPEYKDRVLIKRILAVEGDTVRTLPPYPTREVRIPPGHVWVEGDEPFNSDDSNRFGPVPAALLESRLILLLWPLNRIGQVKIETPSTTSGPQYRQAVAQLEREKLRRMRVTRCKKDRIEVK
ncbi:peptidase S24/S26A/S26B/S26C [Crucibulum laeve]|uniref:Mitochondrial inner membrane protease subunit 2 n=1 Tax=Crucibulum laeve TaxID=68775 RepID=A0A5C3ME81_9AGAR|nr:peptidase S24/S26A/S26B/S26C [Crucibulum laeve]